MLHRSYIRGVCFIIHWERFCTLKAARFILGTSILPFFFKRDKLDFFSGNLSLSKHLLTQFSTDQMLTLTALLTIPLLKNLQFYLAIKLNNKKYLGETQSSVMEGKLNTEAYLLVLVGFFFFFQLFEYSFKRATSDMYNW